MIEFTVLKRSRRSRARLGILKTPHGEVMTPAIVPVATNATVKALRSDEVLATGTQMLISNTYHLHLAPAQPHAGRPLARGGEETVAAASGINAFMQWPRPTMTDSGGFQVFSLGFGRDLGVGKVASASFPNRLERAVTEGAQPQSVKIGEDGVRFRSPLDGGEIFLGPRESIAIQERIGADIMFAFDECTPPRVMRGYMRAALDRTHRWAKACIAAKRTDQALYGIIQGSVFKDLREESAKTISRLARGGGFSGFGIGGDLGDALGTSRIGTRTILNWTVPLLDSRLPRHLLGIGKLDDIETIVKAGVDTFDCTVPTHYARRGIAFVSSKKRGGWEAADFTKAVMLRDRGPIDAACDCLVCSGYRRQYVAHLFRAGEITGGAMLTFHNLYFFNGFVARVREKIKKGLL